MPRYFRYFPTTKYDVANSSFSKSELVRNITLKTRIIDQIAVDDPYLFFSYTVAEGERPETIADFYYGSVDFVWLVLMSNNIVDPYNQWPRDFEDFNAYIRKKFASQAGSVDPIEWAQNTTIDTNIVHYKNIATPTVTISADTYTRAQTFNPEFVPAEWTAVRHYEFELEQNEQYRNIQLLNESYAAAAENNLRNLLNE